MEREGEEVGRQKGKKMEMSVCGDKGGTEQRLGHFKLMLTSKLATAGEVGRRGRRGGSDPPKSIGTIKSCC